MITRNAQHVRVGWSLFCAKWVYRDARRCRVSRARAVHHCGGVQGLQYWRAKASMRLGDLGTPPPGGIDNSSFGTHTSVAAQHRPAAILTGSKKSIGEARQLCDISSIRIQKQGATHQALGNGAANLSFYSRPDGNPALASPFSQVHPLIGSSLPPCSADLPARIAPIKGLEWVPRSADERATPGQVLGVPVRNPWQSLRTSFARPSLFNNTGNCSTQASFRE
ncbi:hypothetical protein LA080_010463 [Diaporthe eres]|nr:hypothetical protein LA080_010463 [Diaporthe eres]